MKNKHKTLAQVGGDDDAPPIDDADTDDRGFFAKAKDKV